MKVYLFGCYNRQTKKNEIKIVHATNTLNATSVLLGSLVYSISPKYSLRVNEYLDEARNVSKVYCITDSDKLLDGEATQSIGHLKKFVNPSIIALYNPKTDTNYLVEFDNTRYVEAVNIFKQQVSTILNDEEVAGTIAEELEKTYYNNITLRNCFSILKKHGYVLSETKSMKIGRI